MNDDGPQPVLENRLAYDVFAWLYDRYWGAHYAGWVAPIAAAFFSEIGSARSVLDLCCGTGRPAACLDRQGFVVTGVDHSFGMADTASNNAPGGRFVVADIRQLPFRRGFDAAICLGGSMNHLPTLASIQTVCRELVLVLRPSAPTILSMTTDEGFRRYWHGRHCEVADDHVLAAQAAYDEAGGFGTIDVTFLRKTEGWHRTDLRITTRRYPTNAIVEVLAAEGYHGIQVLDPKVTLGLPERLGQIVIACLAP